MGERLANPPTPSSRTLPKVPTKKMRKAVKEQKKVAAAAASAARAALKRRKIAKENAKRGEATLMTTGSTRAKSLMRKAEALVILQDGKGALSAGKRSPGAWGRRPRSATPRSQ